MWEGRPCFKDKEAEGLPLGCRSLNPGAKEMEGSLLGAVEGLPDGPLKLGIGGRSWGMTFLTTREGQRHSRETEARSPD